MIAVDWGSSSLRAWRLDDAGIVLERRRADLGALAPAGTHAAVLAGQLDGWDDARILICGMAGARGGWVEAPYVPCPANAQQIARSLVRPSLDGTGLQGRDVHIVPGVSDRTSHVPDVMRGEETQVMGLLATRPQAALLCLPGTHSKWIACQDGVITGLSTAMTGETYALFRHHSMLARTMPERDGSWDADAFDAGVARSREPGGMLHHLFGLRALALADALAPEQAPAYLSGLLVGHEIGARQPPPGQVIHLIGGSHLVAPYQRALQAFGLVADIHHEDLSAAGLSLLARLAP
ncbi:2-dehydro-3-deoxygalactonokinase [Pseudoxanthomonas sp.]|uniref:2-dehydro-3-deoxygalactonokinase n=1 Tax=Pseudoxanthomonas sp. TaxID=1871049 RepID=UPI002630AFC6|nr:2-dehydro-3-deoxygalactonokinase [Pseudoxanthomonas sp.]WDS36189.1 MAG: 2-dehydro-3-deoxygalactonokinase [Pseudoxanthomonas sp.]